MQDDLSNLPRWDGPERRHIPRTGPDWLWFAEDVWVKEKVIEIRDAVSEDALRWKIAEIYRSAFRMGFRAGKFEKEVDDSDE